MIDDHKRGESGGGPNPDVKLKTEDERGEERKAGEGQQQIGMDGGSEKNQRNVPRRVL
jgi:hypothetical protein